MPKKLNVEITCVRDALDAPNALGESPVWSEKEACLYWADILTCRVHRWRPADNARKFWQFADTVGSIGLRQGGGLILALRSGFHLFDTDTGATTFLCHPEMNIPDNRFNDGKVSPEGRFFAGTMDDRPVKEAVASLYSLEKDHAARRINGDLIVSNGLAWSPDGRILYHSDSRAAAVYQYTYDPQTGNVGERKIFVSMKAEWGRPDGATVDVDGCYWSCGVSAGRINRFSPDGELLSYIEMPVSHPTMPCFGGPDMKTMYVTSISAEVPAEIRTTTPLAGQLFEIKLDVAGVQVGSYQG